MHCFSATTDQRPSIAPSLKLPRSDPVTRKARNYESN